MMRALRRHLGTVLAVVGVLLVAYSAVTLLWRDPVTDLYARVQQGQLDDALEQEFAAYSTTADQRVDEAGGGTVAASRKAVAQAAREYEARLRGGKALGRLVIPKLGIDPVFVHGTDWGAHLSKGPGHYEQTSLPGLGETTAIAGHRTTFGAPFRHIDRLKKGDGIVLELPYGTFHYTVFAHEIVDNGDWSVIRERGFDTLVLSACHPLYSADERWIVYARLTRVEPVGGRTYTLAEGEQPAAAPS